ncbi:MAG TPA: ABC transporter permease [Firmicutes bacterium]|nr:ABC transporter permease [Bacillota bacterium]
MMFDPTTLHLLAVGLWETLYMTLFSTFLSYLIGLPLGLILVVTDKTGIRPMVGVNAVLGFIVNFLRSVPFIILLVAVIPLTRFIVGTSLGSTATIVPLVIGAAPFVARMVESSIKEVDAGVIEAAQSMGATPIQIVMKVLLPEARPSLVVGSAIAITTILGYTAMAGFVGGGGLGTIAINYGYYRYQSDMMLVTVLILVVIVQLFQEIGMKLAKIGDRRIK